MRRYEINWRNGTASAYESEWSLARKYCYLNRIGLSHTSDFTLSKYGTNHQDEVAANRALALLIGESNAVISYRTIDRYLLPSNIAGDNQKWPSKYLRYCIQCMNRGYHSPIHQLPWVDCCPLHHTPLTEVCGVCGKQIGLAIWPSAWTRRGGPVALKHICGCDIWPGMKESTWPPGLGRNETRPIGAYLKWLKSLESAPERILARQGLNFITDRPITADVAVELISFWQDVLPPPPMVKSFLIDRSNHTTASFSLKFALRKSQENGMFKLVMDEGYQKVIAGLLCFGDKGPWNYVLRRITHEFAGEHRCCPFSKKEAKRDPELKDFFNLDEDFQCICHRTPILEILNSPFLLFWSKEYPLESIYYGINDLKKYYEIQNRLRKLSLTFEVDYAGQESKDESSFSDPSADVRNQRFKMIVSRIICYRALAIASVLIGKYQIHHKTRDISFHRYWDDKDIADVRNPYVLVSHDPLTGTTVRVWPRHRPIVSLDAHDTAIDAHQPKVVGRLRLFMNRAKQEMRARVINALERNTRNGLFAGEESNTETDVSGALKHLLASRLTRSLKR